MAKSLSAGIDELLAESRRSRGMTADSTATQETGRYIVTFMKEATTEGVRSLSEYAGLRTANASDFNQSAVSFESLGGADALVLPEVGVAVVSAEPEQLEALGVRNAGDTGVFAVEPERIVQALTGPAIGREENDESPLPAPGSGFDLSPAAASYLRGYRDALAHITEVLLGKSDAAAQELAAQPALFVETNFTWGLQATRVHVSSLTGQGIRVAVLDTGFELNHPDFEGRSITTNSFVPGETVQDAHGHGTHCIGTACGPKAPAAKPRYGVAYEAEIFPGKVLANNGFGSDGFILAGINWAIANGCAVISMSLGRGAKPGDPFPIAYEAAAAAGLIKGSLIVAAAGNESKRAQGIINPVGHPASCPSIMAVAAVDRAFQIANFSNRSINPNGGNVDIAGPGVAIRSSWLIPQRYNTISGTSMATPHVAGIAALYAQSSPSLRGTALWKKLTMAVRNIPAIPAVDHGAGLVQSA